MASEKEEDEGHNLTAFAPFEAEKTSRLPYIGRRSSAGVGSKLRPSATATSAGGKAKAVEITGTQEPPKTVKKPRMPTLTTETPRATPPPTGVATATSTAGKQPRVIVVGGGGERGPAVKALKKGVTGHPRAGAAAEKAAPRPSAASTQLQVEGEGEGAVVGQRTSVQLSPPPSSVTVTKSVVLTRIGTLERERVCVWGGGYYCFTTMYIVTVWQFVV